MKSDDLRLKSPFTAIIAGPTGSGKAHLRANLINHASKVCDMLPQEIIYCYSVWPPMYEKMNGVTFNKGMIDVTERIPQDGTARWIIVDDLMEEAKDQANDLYAKYSHHLNVSMLFVTQNLFLKQQRTMYLNAHYLFLFKNPRDNAFISHLARQVYPNDSRFMVESYKDATKEPYSFLLIDHKQNTDE